jgi:ectoine hydroxylase-related dioxygenase (phytanoyl-CoA dioxygenase family)
MECGDDFATLPRYDNQQLSRLRAAGRKMDGEKVRKAIQERGFAIIPDCLDGDACQRILRVIEAINEHSSAAIVRRRNEVYAVRNVLEQMPEIIDVVRTDAVRSFVEAVSGSHAFVVRSILFDKTATANWHVGWHQDLMVPVKQRKEIVGFSAWSSKAGVTHVKPPYTILEQMLTVRIHLEPCCEDDGPLRVITGSHLFGELAPAEIQERITSEREIHCTVPVGGAVLMRPLLLHASSRSRRPKHRRVLHLEFANENLPQPLEWYQKLTLHHSDKT